MQKETGVIDIWVCYVRGLGRSGANVCIALSSGPARTARKWLWV